MAEVRKRNTKGAAAKPSKPAQTQPVSSSGGNTTLVLFVAGIAAVLAIAYFQFQTPSTPESSSTTPTQSQPSIKPTAGPTSTAAIVYAKREFTDEELAAFTGEDPDKPIYVALNGSIFDVSTSRGFYGPGGHYSHFAGRDATRAWVTECFQPEHLTWDMKGVEAMFAPIYMDEAIADAAAGGISDVLPESVKEQAATILEKVGHPTEEEIQQRREEDAVEIKEKIEVSLAHWVNFFRNNPKYKEVGVVVGRQPLDEDRPDIGVCDEAIKKRPVKGGKFQALMGKAMSMGAMGGGEAEDDNKPDFVKGST